jgi:hypothetical protein
MSLVKFIRLLGFMFLVGCAPAVELRDTFQATDYRLSFEQRLRFEASAPTIVVGRVLEVNNIGRPKRSAGDLRIKTQLAEIKISIEVVIKGGARESTINFYYFVYSSESDVDLGVPRYLPEIGQRRIYFLRRQGGIYRSIGDVLDYTLQVRSGLHRNTLCREKQPGCCIAELLLVPGEDLDVPSFVAGLITAKAEASFLCSDTQTRSLLRELTQQPDQRISDRAQEAINMP